MSTLDVSSKAFAQTAYAWLKDVKPLMDELTEAGNLEGIDSSGECGG